MLLLEHLLAPKGCLLLCLLPSVLQAQSKEEERPKPSLCQQSPVKVSCTGVGLQSFPEVPGQGVKYLELSNNFIQNLTSDSMQGFGQLEYLDLGSNQLEAVSDLSLAQLPQLHTLLLGSNHLDHNYHANGRALQLLRSIQVLDLSANSLESHMAAWFITNLTGLRSLHLSGNRMSKLPAEIFWSTPRLRQLDLSNNYIMEIEEGAFEALGELEVVNLALNSLHCVSGFSLRHLRVLNLSHNALELFSSEDGAEPYLLQVLDLSHNRLLCFPELPRAHHLTHLNLSNNLIASLLPGSRHPGDFVLHYEEMGRFRGTWHAGLTRLADLDLSYNHLQVFPVPFFRSLSSLRSLSLARNCLREVAGDGLSRAALPVRCLDLHGNAIRLLPPWLFDSLPLLEALDLGSNSLQPCQGHGSHPGGESQPPAPGGTCTPFYGISHLKHLSLSRNNLTRLQPYAFHQTSLLSLDLSGNRDLSVPREALGGLEFSLRKLSLSGNGMDNSEAELPCLPVLTALDLAGNRLSFLPSGLFCSPLESLDLRDNLLQTLEKPALASWPQSLRDVAIAGNPFSCCSLAWLDTLQGSGVGVRDLDQTLCTYQDESRNFSARISSSPWWLCPRPQGSSSLAVLLAVLSLFILSSGAWCLLRKGQKLSGPVGLHRMRVGVFPQCPKREEPAQVKPADSVTKV
ncbi:transforming growth factor beta activator LRRC32-like [Heliangelus exortis]|uniref:transforming growth factor beta activator LRRC32-like n=1 Tax=Heliangelus exortis TaxID=472823 RepID=UPI003A91047C